MKKRELNLFDAGIAFIIAFALAQLTTIIGVGITQTIMEACGRSADQITKFWDGAWGYLLQTIYMNIAFVLVFIWYYKKRNYPKTSILQKPNNSTWKYVGICVLLGLGSLFFLSGILNYFQLFLDKIGFSSGTLSYEIDKPWKYIVSLISMAVLPAVCEELLFRGIITKALSQKSQLFAVVLSSIMFSIFHFSPSQLIYPLCFGLILGIVYLHTKNILFPILLHFINNALSISIQYFSSGSSSGEFTHSMGTLIYAILTFAIWIFAMYYFISEFKDYIKHNKTQTNSQNDTNPTTQIDNQNTIQTNTSAQDKANEKMNQNTLYGSIILMLVIYIILLFM